MYKSTKHYFQVAMLLYISTESE